MPPLFPAIGATLHTLRRVPFVVYILILQAWILVNAQAIAPAGQVEQFRTILIVYMLLLVVFVRLAPNIPGINMTLNQASIWFVAGFVATTFIVTGFMGLRGLAVPTYAVGATSYLIILHAGVVGIVEELIFRGALTQLITPIPAAAAFAAFHYAAYGADVMGMLIAFAAALIFYVIMRYTNIWVVAGTHAAYNLGVLGIWGTLGAL